MKRYSKYALIPIIIASLVFVNYLTPHQSSAANTTHTFPTDTAFNATGYNNDSGNVTVSGTEISLAQDEAWGHSGLTYKKQLTVTNPTADTLHSGTTLTLNLDTSALIAATKLQADGDDLRIYYQPDASTKKELMRTLTPASGATLTTSTQTLVSFQLQDDILTTASNTYYYLYYGNSSLDYFSKAQSFDGGDLVYRSTISGLDYENNYSITLWFQASALSGDQVLFEQSAGASNFCLVELRDANLTVGHYNGTTYSQKSTTVTAGVWYHVVFTHTSSGVNTLFVNGVSQAGTYVPSAPSTVGFTIGRGTNAARFFTGTIDEFAIYNTIIDATALWNAGTFNKPLEANENTMVLYHLNDAIQTVDDASSTNNDATKGLTSDPSTDDPTTVDSTVNVARSYPGASFVAPMNGSQTGLEGESATYTRNSVGTYIDDAGKIQEVTANNPRYEKRYEPNVSLNSGLVAHYKMNESSWPSTPGAVHDSVGNYHGTAVNSPTISTSGKLGNAGEFNGNNSYVNLGDITQLNSASAFSLAFWVNQDIAPATDRMFQKSIDGSNDFSFYYEAAVNRIFIELGNGGNTYAYVPNYDAIITQGNWYHMSLVYNGAGVANTDKLKLYINGNPTSLTYNGTIPATTANLSGAPADLGGTASTLDGKLDDFRIYSTAISQATVTALYNSGTGIEDYNNTPPRSTVIEEARTNYLLTSSFEADTDANGRADNWNLWKDATGTPTFTQSTDYVHGTKSQRFQYTGVAGDNNTTISLGQTSAVGTFAEGESVTSSVWTKGTTSGVNYRIYLQAVNAAGSTIASTSVLVNITGSWQKVTLTYPSLPAETSRVGLNIYPGYATISEGDTFDVYIDAVQLEKGKFATSYIPTTTATVARSTDALTYPTAGNIDYNAGTVSMWVKNEWDGDDGLEHMWFDTTGSATNRIVLWKNAPNSLTLTIYGSTGSKTRSYAVSSANFSKNTWYMLSFSYDKTGNAAVYLNGSALTTSDTSSSWADMNAIGATMYIGEKNNSGSLSDSNISDCRIYNSAFSAPAVKDIYNATSSTYGYGAESVARYQNSGTYTSPVVDLANNAGWQSGENFVPTQALNSGTVTYQTRVGDNGFPDPVASPTHWSSWSAVSGNAIQSSGYPGKRYLQWKALLAPPADQSNSPTITGLTVNYTTDSTAPTNPTDTDGWKTSSKTSGEELTSGNYSNSPNPYFEWTGQTDDQNLYGYYVYFGTEVDAEPFTAGTLQTTANYTSNTELVTGTTYYLRVRSVDRAGNTYTNADTSAYTLFTYQYDGTAPAQPEYANVSPAGCSTNANFTFTWPAVTDSVSGLASYEYKKGSTGTVQTTTDTSVTLTPYQDGDNVFYVRTKDNAGSVSPWTTAIFCSTGIAHLVEGPTVEAGPSSIIVNWTSSKATTSYVKVYQGNTYVSEQGHLDYSTTHNVKVLGLKPEQSYQYQVAWLDSDGNAGESDWFNTSTPVTPRVVGLRSQILSPTSVVVSYTTNYSASTAIKYGVGGYSTEIPMAGVGTTFSQQIDGLTGGTTYQIAIDALTDDGSNFSIGDAFTTPPLPAISNLRFEPIADRASSSIKVTWLTNVETTSSIFFSPKGEKKLEKTTVEKVKDHEIEITDLNDNANYEIYAYGIDQYGNTTTSSINTYSTPFDTRAPKISNITIETSNVGLGQKDKAQMAVSWKTDEATTSQVEYAEGVSGTEYTSKTQEDPTLTNSHLVIISDLTPGKPYHLRVVSKDKGGNTTNSEDNTVIAGEVPKSTLQLILKVLNNTFGWLGRLL